MTKPTIISASVTSWKKHQGTIFGLLKSEKADTVALQETRLTPITQARAVAQAASKDFDFLGGKPPRSSRSDPTPARPSTTRVCTEVLDSSCTDLYPPKPVRQRR
eukprot:2668644-Pyramimonas_sp.AAC.1